MNLIILYLKVFAVVSVILLIWNIIDMKKTIYKKVKFDIVDMLSVSFIIFSIIASIKYW